MARKRRAASPFSLFAFQDIITSVTGIMILVTMMLTLELLERKEQSPPVKTEQILQQVQQAAVDADDYIEQLESELAESDVAIRYDSQIVRRQIEEAEQSNERVRTSVERLRRESEQAAERLQDLQARQQRREEHDPEVLAQLEQQVQDADEQLQRLTKSNRMIFNPSAGDAKKPWLVEIAGEGIQVAQAGVAARPEQFGSVAEFLSWTSQRSQASEYFVLLIKPSGVESFGPLNESLQRSGFDVGYDVLTADQSAIDSETGAAP